MKRLFIVFLLGFSSGLPLALLTSTLQAWFAETGMSVLATGMLSLITLPYSFRVLWSPILDRYKISSLGKRRTWIILTQIILILGFNLIVLFSPKENAEIIAFIAFILAFISATQDAVVDAHRTEYLNYNTHALGASLAVSGYRLALLFSGGLALILANYCGWAWTYHCISLLFVFGILAILFSQEPISISQGSSGFGFLEPLKDLSKRIKCLPLLLFILLYKLGEAFTTTTSGIVMPFLIQGLGFSLDTIGYINKIFGLTAILAGGLVAGLLLLRWSLYKALMLFGILQALTNVLFVWLALAGKNIVLFAFAVGFDNFIAGMGTTTLVAFFMKIVNKQFTATQLSLLVAIASLPRIFSGPFAALIQIQLGWVGLYLFSVLIALGFIPFLINIKNLVPRKDHDISNPESTLISTT